MKRLRMMKSGLFLTLFESAWTYQDLYGERIWKKEYMEPGKKSLDDQRR